MSELIINQSLTQKSIGPRQEQSLQILQKDFLSLAADISNVEEENPFLDITRQKDIAEYEFVRYREAGFSARPESEGRGIDVMPSGRGVSLYQFLVEQLALTRLTERQMRIATRLISDIDNSGYYLASINDAARQLVEEPQMVESVLTSVVQCLEPAGVGARNISECLLLQLAEDERQDTLLVNIIRHELMQVAQNKLGTIAKKYGAKIGDVKRRCDRLRQLSPKPGGTYTDDVVQYVFADIIVENKDGKFAAQLAEGQMLDVSVNRAYIVRMMHQGDDSAADFIKKKAQQAEWICQCIRRRRETLKKIADHIVKHQTAFFDSGSGHLCPMTMKRMAADIGVHESTVSRGISGKYLQCRWGVFPLKYFFSASINGVSAEAIKQRIVCIIADEQKTRPLSDQRIADILRNEIGSIARRTITKYRRECRIPAASQRRQY